jgi:membrane dipeptidase
MKKINEISEGELERAMNLHKEAVYVQGLESVSEPTPEFPGFDEAYVSRLKAGGITALHASVAWPLDDFRSTALKLMDWHSKLAALDGAMPVFKVDDVHEAKRSGKVGVIFGQQDSSCVENDLRFVGALQRLGLRIMTLTYQRRTLAGDGCGERTDCGLSEFGWDLIGEMNTQGLVVDLSHVGRQTALDAIEASNEPVIFSHSNARGLRDHVRNIDDKQMKALAENGGVMGICSFRIMLRQPHERPTYEDFLDHLDYAVGLIGVDHVGIGIDRVTGVPTREHYQNIKDCYPELRTGLTFEMWSEGTLGAGDPENDVDITKGLVARGYSDAEIGKILGGNWLRVFRTVF